MELIGYWRSTAAWRVRIGLNLKGIPAAHSFRHLLRDEQRAPDYLSRNPQGLLPTLLLEDGTALGQSLAILEYLEETRPEPPLLPRDPVERARVRGIALAICCDIHPVQNLKVQQRLRGMGHDAAAVRGWAREVIADGLAACERLLGEGPFCFGAEPTLADLCLVPQLFNARRFEVDLTACPRLLAVEAACAPLPAFAAARPERQPDAE